MLRELSELFAVLTSDATRDDYRAAIVEECRIQGVTGGARECGERARRYQGGKRRDRAHDCVLRQGAARRRQRGLSRR